MKCSGSHQDKKATQGRREILTRSAAAITIRKKKVNPDSNPRLCFCFFFVSFFVNFLFCVLFDLISVHSFSIELEICWFARIIIIYIFISICLDLYSVWFPRKERKGKERQGKERKRKLWISCFVLFCFEHVGDATSLIVVFIVVDCRNEWKSEVSGFWLIFFLFFSGINLYVGLLIFFSSYVWLWMEIK